MEPETDYLNDLENQHYPGSERISLFVVAGLCAFSIFFHFFSFSWPILSGLGIDYILSSPRHLLIVFVRLILPMLALALFVLKKSIGWMLVAFCTFLYTVLAIVWMCRIAWLGTSSIRLPQKVSLLLVVYTLMIYLLSRLSMITLFHVARKMIVYTMIAGFTAAVLFLVVNWS